MPTPVQTPAPQAGPADSADAHSTTPNPASCSGNRPENHEKARLWSIGHVRQRPEGQDRETWLAAVKGWLNGL